MLMTTEVFYTLFSSVRGDHHLLLEYCLCCPAYRQPSESKSRNPRADKGQDNSHQKTPRFFRSPAANKQSRNVFFSKALRYTQT